MNVLVLLAICYFQTVSAFNLQLIGRLGEELDLKFPPAEMKEDNAGLEISKDFKVTFTKINSSEEVLVFMDGKTMNHWSQTETFLDHKTLIVKVKKLDKEDVGIYRTYSGTDYLGQICVSVTGRPQITRREIPNLVLKPGQNQTTTTLACPSVSTSIGDCQLASSMYIIWYENGVRMTELDPTLSQINVTVDQNGDTFTCVVVDGNPCYEKLQATNYNEVRNITDCNGVTEKRTFFIKPEYKAVPDIYEDLNVWDIIVPVVIIAAVIAVIAGIVLGGIWYKKCRRENNRNNNDKEQDNETNETLMNGQT